MKASSESCEEVSASKIREIQCPTDYQFVKKDCVLWS
jgi:hypothetical protein